MILKFYKFWYSFYIHNQKESLNIFFAPKVLSSGRGLLPLWGLVAHHSSNPHILGEVPQIREIKIHVHRKRENVRLKLRILRIENKQIKTVPNDSYC